MPWKSKQMPEHFDVSGDDWFNTRFWRKAAGESGERRPISSPRFSKPSRATPFICWNNGESRLDILSTRTASQNWRRLFAASDGRGAMRRNCRRTRGRRKKPLEGSRLNSWREPRRHWPDHQAQQRSRNRSGLCRRKKNNPLYVGEPGVSKTARWRFSAENRGRSSRGSLERRKSFRARYGRGFSGNARYRGDFWTTL